jgi:polysaccharide chain length determinant protein (PEP-CTERM system associated)
MQEILDLLVTHARSAWRYRWPAIATAWAVCVVGWIVVALLDDVYEAQASVYVDTTSQLRRLLDNQIIEPDLQEQLQYVQQALLGRVQLERVATSTGLLRKATTPDEVQDVIDALAANVTVSAHAPQRNQTPNYYVIRYQNKNRSRAVDVVNALLESFVDDTLETQQASSETSRAFLIEQIRENEQRLAAAEQRLADFNRRNYDRLPGQQGGYFQRLQAESAQLDQTRQMLREVQSRRESINQQMRGEAPRVSGVISENSIEGRILQQQARLEDLLLQYTENHPDVVAVRESLGRLIAQRDQQSRSAAADPTGSFSNNPVYQALLIARNEVEAEVATLAADLENRERRVNDLRSLIDEMPNVEAELARLNRDYDVIHAQYQALVNSLERERLTREVMRSDQIDFRVINPPAAGHEPAAPKRAVLVPLVLLLGLGAGAGVALLLSLYKPVFNDLHGVESSLGLPVLGSVAYCWSLVGRQQKLRALGRFATACVALAAVCFGVFVFEVFGPGLRGLT